MIRQEYKSILNHHKLKILHIGSRLLFRDSRLNKYIAERKKNNQPLHINIGCGSGLAGEAKASYISRNEWIDTDIIGRSALDATRLPKALSNSVATFFSSHVVEHLTLDELQTHFTEIKKALIPSGTYYIATPDLDRVVELLFSPPETDQPAQNQEPFITRHTICNGYPATTAHALNAIMHLNYGHKFLHNFDSISHIAQQCGLAASKVPSFDNIDEQTIKEYLKTRGHRYQLETSVFKLTPTDC